MSKYPNGIVSNVGKRRRHALRVMSAKELQLKPLVMDTIMIINMQVVQGGFFFEALCSDTEQQ